LVAYAILFFGLMPVTNSHFVASHASLLDMVEIKKDIDV